MSTAVQEWLSAEFASCIAAAIDGLTGVRYPVKANWADAPDGGGIVWRQPFSTLPGALWIVASDETWRKVAEPALPPGGMTDSEHLKAQYLDVVRQAVVGLSRAMSDKCARDIAPEPGEMKFAGGDAAWSSIEIVLPGFVSTIAVGLDAEFSAALAAACVRELATAETAISKIPQNSKTFELLLDLELPVSISFGRASVPLKDALKLTVGSIVELNRTIIDPVEVIVNNCVIARGQVVVVEGNFGVRILNVISTQDRLRSLD